MNKSLLLIITLLLVSNFFAQEKEYNLDEIVVSAGRSPVSFNNLARAVTVLNSAEIKSLPAGSVLDLLKYVNAVDLKTRGAEGVQADVGIRGGTFEQTLILIDGVKISDPQTGHHNLNLPISLDNIERIEVLKGQGSRIFGSNAFGGAINIITKKEKNSSISIAASGGQNNLYNFGLSASYPVSTTGNNFSFSKKKSDGYRLNTDFDVTDFSLGQNYSIGNSTVNLFLGYTDKKFGANNFYSDLYQNQREHTTTKILNASSEIGMGSIIISPKIFWRQNSDDYVLDFERPSFYRNNHKTNSYGTEIQTSLKSEIGITSFGGEINKEEITSNNLGNHARLKGGIFGEQLFEITKSFSASAGFFVYNYSNIGWKIWPGIDASYKISEVTKIFASAGRAFRIPTFTELYYKSPANLGNPNLTFEEATNYEAGVSYFENAVRIEASIFYKIGKNIIDWARSSQTEPWKVENVTNINTAGTEIGFTYFPNFSGYKIPITKINFNYTYLTAERSTGVYQSKYVLENLRHQLITNIDNDLPFGLTQSWAFIYRDRVNFKAQFTIDSQINASINNFNFFLRVTNLLNKTIEDFPGVVLPGRWISCGVKYSLNDF